MAVKVRLGAEIALRNFERYQREDIGDLLEVYLEKDTDATLRGLAWCRRNRIRCIIGEIMNRYTFDIPNPRYQGFNRKFARAAEAALGKYLVARQSLGEAAQPVFCLRGYGLNRMFPPAKDLVEAKAFYMARLKKALAVERGRSGKMPLAITDPGMFHSYHLDAGFDHSWSEVLPGDVNLLTAAMRGAYRAHGRKDFLSYIAMGWYGGLVMDELWFSRWKTALYHAYISGAEKVMSESGHWENHALGNKAEFDSAECRRFRAIMREFHHFCRSQPRPENGPEARIAVVQGHLDGYAGLWNKQVWGQYGGKHWQHGPAEYGWDYFNEFFRKQEWFNNLNVGERDCSGNPPCGQVDVIPANTPLKVMRRYSCLLFLGWNTMTPALYGKLRRYVAGGGHLFMAVPHLNVGARRDRDLELFRNGDVRDLFGVTVLCRGRTYSEGIKILADSSLEKYKLANWTGACDPKFSNGPIRVAKVETRGATALARISFSPNWRGDKKEGPPILVEKRLGKGVAFLLTSWDYPGSKGLEPFMKDIIRVINAGEQPDDILVEATDKVRYARYEEKGLKTLCLLNTDPGLAQQVILTIWGKSWPLAIPANELRIVWAGERLAVSPADKSVHVQSIRGRTVRLAGVKRQSLELLRRNGGGGDVLFRFGGHSLKVPGSEQVVLDFGRGTARAGKGAGFGRQ